MTEVPQLPPFKKNVRIINVLISGANTLSAAEGSQLQRGLATGEGVAGNVGENKRIEYTVIGDALTTD